MVHISHHTPVWNGHLKPTEDFIWSAAGELFEMSVTLCLLHCPPVCWFWLQKQLLVRVGQLQLIICPLKYLLKTLGSSSPLRVDQTTALYWTFFWCCSPVSTPMSKSGLWYQAQPNDYPNDSWWDSKPPQQFRKTPLTCKEANPRSGYIRRVRTV